MGRTVGAVGTLFNTNPPLAQVGGHGGYFAAALLAGYFANCDGGFVVCAIPPLGVDGGGRFLGVGSGAVGCALGRSGLPAAQ